MTKNLDYLKDDLTKIVNDIFVNGERHYVNNFKTVPPEFYIPQELFRTQSYCGYDFFLGTEQIQKNASSRGYLSIPSENIKMFMDVVVVHTISNIFLRVQIERLYDQVWDDPTKLKKIISMALLKI